MKGDTKVSGFMNQKNGDSRRGWLEEESLNEIFI